MYPLGVVFSEFFLISFEVGFNFDPWGAEKTLNVFRLAFGGLKGWVVFTLEVGTPPFKK